MKVLIFSFILAAATFGQTAQDKAWKLHNRISSLPPTAQELNQMVQLINQNPGRVGLEKAAEVSIESNGFYNITLKNMFKPLSNVNRDSRVVLNDMVATMIGAVRDSDAKPFNRILYEDLVYVGPSMGPEGNSEDEINNANNLRYRTNDNRHYQEMERRKLNLKDVLVERKLTETIKTENNPGAESESTRVLVNQVDGSAGVLTSRAYATEFFSAGTNRRVTRYTFMNFMCKDFEDLHDTSIPDFRVARDVDRAPGGDSRVYKNNCAGCHAGQDALRGALAYYDEDDGHILFSPGQVREKMNRGAIYMQGFLTQDDSWINTWTQGKNASLGWREPTQGQGLKDWGRMFARSSGFAQCMADRVYRQFCYRSPDQDEQQIINEFAEQFESSDNYNFKKLVTKTIAKCMEDEYAN